MRNFLYIILLLAIGCTAKPETNALYSISSKAQCKGPTRDYHTELHATVDGYTRFHQTYFDDVSDYDAIIYDDTLGFTLANDTIQRWTDATEISIGKSHSFHMIAFNPKLVFSYSNGKYFDTIGNEVEFTFDQVLGQVKNFQLTNPLNNDEKIEIFFSKWESVQDTELPMQVQIIQGGKDEYFFEFYEVKINDPALSKISPN